MNIRTQISKSRQCSNRLAASKFPDYGAVACLERNADAMEAMVERNELLEKVLDAAKLVLDEADDAAEQPYEGVSPVYVQETMHEAIAACDQLEEQTQ